MNTASYIYIHNPLSIHLFDKHTGWLSFLTFMNWEKVNIDKQVDLECIRYISKTGDMFWSFSISM